MAKGEVRYRLVLDSKAFTDGIKAAKSEAAAMASDMSSKLGKAGSVLSSMGPAGLAAAAGVGALATAAAAAVKATIDATSQAMKYGDAMAALQDKTGLSSKALQDLEVAAKLGNSSLEAIASAVNKMQKGIVDGSTAFGKLGLSLQDLKAMSPEEQFKAVAVAIENINDPAQRAAARMAVFGKSGNDLAGTLKAAAAGATELGGALSDEALGAAAALQDQADLLDSAWDRVVLQFGAAVAQSPELQRGLEDITNALVAMAEAVAKLAPLIAKLFDGLVTQGRNALAVVKAVGVAAVGGPIAGALSLKNDMSQISLDAMFGDVSGGGSSSGIKKPSGSFSGAGADKAAAAAEKRKELFAKVLMFERQKWAEWQEDQFKGAMDLAKRLDDVQKKASDEYVKELNARDKAYDEMQKAMMEKATADEERMRELRFQANQEWVAGLNEVAGALQDLGGAAGGAFGTLLGLGGAAVQVFSNLKNEALRAASNTQKIAGAISAAASIMSGPGGAKGALSGAAQGAAAGAAFGGIGAVIGGVAGGILGLFGGPSKAEKQAEQQKQIKDTISKMEDLLQKAKQLKMEQLTAGVGGLAAMFAHLGNQTNVSGERLERFGRFGQAMFNQLRAEGLSTVEAFNAMGPALDKAIEAIERNGGKITGAFASLIDFRNKVKANEGLVGGVEGFNSLVSAMPLNKDSIVDVQAELKTLFDELITKGFTADQALSLLAPTLLEIRDAAREGRIQIDAGTDAMITQAEQGGHFENLKDPMDELVEVQKMMLELWAAIAHMQGVTLPASLREYINTLHQAQTAQGGVGGGAGANLPGGGGQPKYFPDAGGGDITPGQMSAGFKGMGGNLQVPIVLDGRELGKGIVKLTRNNTGEMRSQGQRYIR